MARLIDADRLKQYFDIVGVNDYGCSFATIDSQPTVDAEPVRHGNWIRNGVFCAKCSECGKNSVDIGKYCSNCGAKLE